MNDARVLTPLQMDVFRTFLNESPSPTVTADLARNLIATVDYHRRAGDEWMRVAQRRAAKA